MTLTYIYLALAILAEVTATSALKSSAEFTQLVPSIIVIVGYGVSFYFMTLVLRTLPLGITYAVWSSVGIVLLALVGFVVYNQSLDAAAIIGMGMIIGGVIIIHLFSNTIHT